MILRWYWAAWMKSWVRDTALARRESAELAAQDWCTTLSSPSRSLGSRGWILGRPSFPAISTERQGSPNRPISSNGTYERLILPNLADSCEVEPFNDPIPSYVRISLTCLACRNDSWIPLLRRSPNPNRVANSLIVGRYPSHYGPSSEGGGHSG